MIEPTTIDLMAKKDEAIEMFEWCVSQFGEPGENWECGRGFTPMSRENIEAGYRVFPEIPRPLTMIFTEDQQVELFALFFRNEGYEERTDSFIPRQHIADAVNAWTIDSKT